VKREKELFPTFAKIYKRIPVSFYEPCGFVLLMVLIGLLLLEQITVLHFGLRTFDFLYPIVGTLILVFSLLYAGHRLYLQGGAAYRGLTVTDWALLAFLGWGAVSVIFSEDPFFCFVGSVYRKEGLVTWFLYGGVFAAARLVRERRYQNMLLRTLAVVGCCLSVVAGLWSEEILSAYPSVIRFHRGMDLIAGYTSVFLNSNHFAYFLTMAILTQAGMFLLEDSGKWRAAALGMFSVSYLVLLRNNTLGGFLAVTVGLLFLYTVVLIRDKGKLRGCVLLSACWLGILLLSQTDVTTMDDNLMDVSAVLAGDTERRSTSSQRLDMWKKTLAMIAEDPVFGTGLEGAGKVFYSGENDRPHNEYLQYALFTGIPGLGAYLTALIALLLRCIRNLKQLSSQALILGTVVFGYCASAFVGNSMYYTTIYYVMVLGLLTASCQTIEEKEK